MDDKKPFITTPMAFAVVMAIGVVAVTALLHFAPQANVIPGFGYLLALALIFDIVVNRMLTINHDPMGMTWRANVFIVAAAAQLALEWLLKRGAG